MDAPATELVPHIQAFRGFVQRRLNDPAVADDIVQDSLLRAMQAAPELRDADALLPWFYRILHNAVTDHYRRGDVAGRALQSVATDPQASLKPEDWAS